jgi:hypothetical protein
MSEIEGLEIDLEIACATQDLETILKARHSLLAKFYAMEAELADERAGRPLLAKATDRINDLEAELAALREAERWVPVSERLPEVYTDVLVLWHWDGHPEGLNYDITRMWKDETSLIVHDGDFDKQIVCWRPLPDPSEVKP